MIYKLRSSLLQVKYSILDGSEHEQPIHDMLAMYDKGEDISNSPFIKAGKWFDHKSVGKVYDLNKAIKRQDEVIELYESIKNNGYNGSLIYIWFDRDGYARVYDGFHRISIMNYLGMNVLVNTTTDLLKEWSNGLKNDPDFIYEFGDFPLAKALTEQTHTSGGWIYHPINDNRVSEFKVIRTDSSNRLEYILDNLVGDTVLDIGCAEGYFTREIARRGYKVTGIDRNRDLVAIARYLSILEGVDITYKVGDWGDIIKDYEHFDNILLLSVIHNDMKEIGVKEGLNKLKLIKNKTNRLFFEVPENKGEKQWNIKGFPSYDFHSSINDICKNLNMSNLGNYKNSRTMYQLGESAVLKDLIFNKDINGYPMYLMEEDIFTERAINNNWEPKTVKWLKNNLKAGQTFVDVGAHIGLYTVLASKLVGDTGKVYAFEPSTKCYETLIKNINLNNCNNVSAFKLGLSDKNMMSRLYRPTSNYIQQFIQDVVESKNELGGLVKYNSQDVLNSNNFENIVLNRLDSILDSSPDVIKIDTEGAELLVLKGMGNLLCDVKNIIIEEHSSNVRDWLIKEHGFNIVYVSECDKYMLSKNVSLPTATQNKTKFHLLGLPYTRTVAGETLCAFTNLIYRMAVMLDNMGYEVYHYGTEGSNPPCTEQIDIVSNKLFFKVYGGFDSYKEQYKVDSNDLASQTFKKNAIKEIGKRISPQDIILISGGYAQKDIADAFPNNPSVEFIVGYIGCFAKYKVFPSYSWMHHLYGKNLSLTKNYKNNVVLGNWYDAVIPHYLDPNEFTFSDEKDDYFLFIGRLIETKGAHVAVDVCKKIGKKIIVAGQPPMPSGKPGYNDFIKSYGLNQPHVDYVGAVNAEKRNKLMSKAKAVFVPSMYFEPFGLVVVESLLCGTPVITTDWGSFPELVRHDEVGYRCRTMDDFQWAARNIDKIDSHKCRKYAEENYSMDRIAGAYKEYFMKITDLFKNGWYTERPERDNLDWLKRYGV